MNALRAICSRVKLLSPILTQPLKAGYLHTSSALRVKEIIVKKEGKTTICEGVVHDSERKNVLLKTEHDDYACPICRLNLDIKHTDVMILSQFVRSDGCMLPRRITGLCKQSQKRISRLVSMAHVAGLMPNLVPKYSKPNCQMKRRDWKKYNTYFEEKTIVTHDCLREDKNGMKAAFYKSKGLTWDEEPWKNRPGPDIAQKKIVLY